MPSNKIKTPDDTAIITTDFHGIISIFNHHAEKLLGFSADDVVGRLSPLAFLNKDEIQFVESFLKRKLDTNLTLFELLFELGQSQQNKPSNWTIHRKNGESFRAKLSFSLIKNQNQKIDGIIIIIEPSEEIPFAAHQFHCHLKQAPLYEIPQKDDFEAILLDAIEHHSKQKQTFSLLILDVDFFRNYCQIFGTNEAMDALEKISNMMSQVLSHHQAMYAYLGQDEFGIAAPQTELTSSIKIAEHIRLAIQHLQINHPNSPVSPFMSASLGVFHVKPTSKTSIKTLLQTTYNAVQMAKTEGYNCTRVAPHALDYR